MKPACLLFDLDGTLVDTAPDLAFAANAVRAEAGLPPLPAADYRSVASAGARGLLRTALGLQPEDVRYPPCRDSFLRHYRTHLSRESQLFPGMGHALAALERCGVRWGVVTNKPQWLTDPLLQALQLSSRAACVIGAVAGRAVKPSPDPLLAACANVGVEPGACVYVGDDRRDVDAARAAGMPVVVAAWGYLGEGENCREWGADAILERPQDLERFCA